MTSPSTSETNSSSETPPSTSASLRCPDPVGFNDGTIKYRLRDIYLRGRSDPGQSEHVPSVFKVRQWQFSWVVWVVLTFWLEISSSNLSRDRPKPKFSLSAENEYSAECQLFCKLQNSRILVQNCHYSVSAEYSVEIFGRILCRNSFRSVSKLKVMCCKIIG